MKGTVVKATWLFTSAPWPTGKGVLLASANELSIQPNPVTKIRGSKYCCIAELQNWMVVLSGMLGKPELWQKYEARLKAAGADRDTAGPGPVAAAGGSACGHSH